MSETPAVVRAQQLRRAPGRAVRTLDYDFAAEDSRPRRSWKTEQRWYGWQTLAADGAALTLIVLGASEYDRGGEGLVALGIGTYVFGGPAIHAVHRRAPIVFGSLGLRVGAPLVGTMGGAAIAKCDTPDRGERDEDSSFCGALPMAIGFLLGVSTAILVDADLLARETVRIPRVTRETARPLLAPGIALTPKKRVLVLAGTF